MDEESKALVRYVAYKRSVMVTRVIRGQKHIHENEGGLSPIHGSENFFYNECRIRNSIAMTKKNIRTPCFL